MFNKTSRTERSFSVMLGEELLRAELKKLYGDGVKLFQCDIEAPAPMSVKPSDATMSEPEREHMMHSWRDIKGKVGDERWIKITAIVGPCGPLSHGQSSEDHRRKLRRVEAHCRVFNITTSAIQWRPHFLHFTIKNEFGQVVDAEHHHYESGRIYNGDQGKNTENPCQDMCDSQTGANYPEVHRALHDGVDRHA